ncbi:TetR/AcrR family transcriptional regulator [Streptomyces sp. AC536]|uniref:TetR/AcrR family transcriptional regulator n=1 Tax=Streptomyces buecherae TaxID=2763006 RepID=UPI00164D2A16|nr:TetR/AcrR family transcriptional regulator [Streptomyces buecherae]MBC3987026.1 TetR/AcrR family transcriptional regulator [Streptomyces buecherae]QNJ40708.1 TetR/AcrR family transcriptional regulator [Streptomyces buecherae]
MTPTRARILDAAERLLRTIGLARATTKEIARAAGCSEAALYKHFRNKEDIFVRVLEERLPKLGPLLAELTEHPGERDMTENLTEIARRAAEFYASSVPIIAALYAEPTLLKRHNEGLREINAGPRRPLDGLAGYLRAERAAGRLRPDADCDSAAALLLGACCQRAFLLSTDENEPPLAEFAADLARTVLRGIG